ncbi:prepilin-type N-terminal cleavage/methylation domain-containing protein [Patescibacteria group bacterium]|nr:prepilin-type N-terminal cleavage/methylation domain-containing protein [Patescibacteria group bacterium]
MKLFNNHFCKKGFTLIEILIVISIIGIISTILMTSFSLFNKSEALDKDTDAVVESLEGARSLTLSSQNASQYGVHFGTSKITIFTGTSYTESASTNRDVVLSPTDTILTISLTGGGSDVVFKRLTGETTQNGTVIISSPSTSKTRTVTIYKTGVIESQ